MSTPDLVVVGNLLVDDLVYDDGRTRMAQPGGALLHAALGASVWGTKVGLVSIVGSDYPREALQTMASRGVSLEGLRHLETPGVRVWLLYENGARRMIPRLGRPSHEAVSPLPEHVPKAYHGAPALHVAPMPLSRQRAMVEAFGNGGRLVSLDPCEPLSLETLPVFRACSEHTDVVFLSDDEIDIASREEALASLVGGRTRYVLHKRGRHGGTVYLAGSRTRTWSASPANEIDPTGAGDVFAAAFMAALATRASLEDALSRAAASAARAVEGIGSESIRDSRQSDLERRMVVALLD